MQNYLKADSELNLEEKKMDFKIRTRMIEVRMNMNNKHNLFTCIACESKNENNNETQEHIITAQTIAKVVRQMNMT